MLPFKNRLVRKKDLGEVHKKGRVFSSENVSIKVIKNNLLETRIGITAGLKFSKKAVERNLIKRQLREIYKKILPSIQKGWDIVTIAKRKKGEKVKFEKILEEIKEILIKNKLMQ